MFYCGYMVSDSKPKWKENYRYTKQSKIIFDQVIHILWRTALIVILRCCWAGDGGMVEESGEREVSHTLGQEQRDIKTTTTSSWSPAWISVAWRTSWPGSCWAPFNAQPATYTLDLPLKYSKISPRTMLLYYTIFLVSLCCKYTFLAFSLS